MDLEKQLAGIVDDIMVDYASDESLLVNKGYEQPSRVEMKELIGKLQQILFPSCFKNPYYKTYTVKNNLTMLLEDVLYRLHRQVMMVLRINRECTLCTEEELSNRAYTICLNFLRKIPELRQTLLTDVDATFDGDPAAFSKDEIILSYPGLYAIMIYRLAHALHELKVPVIPRIMTEIAHSETGIDINPGATIGKYFMIDHGTGIVIGETTIIGENVKIYQGVTIGALSTRGGQSLKDKKRHPTIEDRVTIYAGASILGGQTIIGHDSVIGSNTFITSSVEPNSKISSTK